MRPLRLGNVRSILVLNRNHIGDCVLTTPMLRALKRRFPRARMVVAIPDGNRDLISTNPHVDEIIERPDISNWGSKVNFAFEVRKREFDLIISLQEKSTFYAWASQAVCAFNKTAPMTVALDHPRTRRFYQHTIRPVRVDQHEVYKYLDVAAALGCPRDRNPVLELQPPDSAHERIDRFLLERDVDPEERFIAINPGGTKPDKRWAVERFAQVADRLHAELGLTSVIFGSQGDYRRGAAIAAQMSSHQPVVACGQLSLGETAAMLERCRFMITGDTGPMHMAVALAVPVVALFGPTSPVKFGPFTSLRTVLKHEQPCPTCNAPCLHSITADECVEAALKLYTAPPAPKKRVERR